MNHHNETKALLPLYALGVLAEEEQRGVEAHLAASADAQIELAEYAAVVGLLPEVTAPVAPPPALKMALLARVQADKAAASRPKGKPASKWSAANNGLFATLRHLFYPPVAPVLIGLTAVFLLLLGGWALSLSQQTAVMVAQLEERAAIIADLQTSISNLERANAELELEQETQALVVARLANPATQIITVAATEAGGEAAGRLLRTSGEAELLFLGSNLAALGAEQTYQFWLISADGMLVSGGTFAADASGAGQVVVAETAVSDLAAVGVSIEPAGGSKQPTADQIILLGEL